MEFVIAQSILKETLNLVGAAVPGNPTHPILGNILINVKDNQATFTGFDLVTSITATVAVESAVDGTITLPAATLKSLITKLEPQVLSLKLTDNDEFTIYSNSGEFVLRGLAAYNYPALPSFADAKAFEIQTKDFAAGIDLVSFCCSKEEIKQILTGVNIKKTGNTITFAATDSHRLATVSFLIDGVEDFTATIHGKGIKEISKIIKNQTSFTLKLIKDSMVEVTAGNMVVTTRCLAGGYPAYQNILPNSFKIQGICNRQELINKSAIVNIVSDALRNVVKWDFAFGSLYLSASTEGNNAKEMLKVEGIEQAFEIAFNSKYLLDGLKIIPGERITINANDSNQPIIFTPQSGIDFTYLVMPVQIVK